MTSSRTQPVDGFFYGERDAITRTAATKILELLARPFGTFDSVLDIGCGVGTWLAVAEKMGASILRGLEAPWITEVADTVVEHSLITVQDLECVWSVERHFNLGICLEVAEHLSPPAGDLLVKNLASNCALVLFSAAIPGQGGNGHINEQWPSYWQDRFSASGMEAIDCIRPLIWDDDSVPWWYRQNTVVFASERLADQYYNWLKANRESRRGSLLPLTIAATSTRSGAAKKASTSKLRRRVGRFLQRANLS